MVIPVVPWALDGLRESKKARISDRHRGFIKASASSGVTLGSLIPFRKSLTCSGSSLHG